MEILKDRIKEKMKAKSPDCEVMMFDGTDLVITWPEKGHNVFINGIKIENALPGEVARVQECLNLKSGDEINYTDPAQNPAIVTDEPTEPEKKSDEIDYTDPEKNPAIPINQ